MRKKPSDGTVLVAGGGIGGLTLGCALQRAGLKFEIFERAPSFGEVGAGILVQPGAMLALRHLGLDARVAEQGHELHRGTGKTVAGRVLHTTPLDGLGAPSVAIHRARLQAVLPGAIEAGHPAHHPDRQ